MIAPCSSVTRPVTVAFETACASSGGVSMIVMIRNKTEAAKVALDVLVDMAGLLLRLSRIRQQRSLGPKCVDYIPNQVFEGGNRSVCSHHRQRRPGTIRLRP